VSRGCIVPPMGCCAVATVLRFPTHAYVALHAAGRLDEVVPLEPAAMPELERLMLHRLAELDVLVRQAYVEYDYKRIFAALNQLMTVDLSAFYFDIRKDALYCDAPSSVRRKASVVVVRHIFECMVKWLAPLLPFTTEEA